MISSEKIVFLYYISLIIKKNTMLLNPCIKYIALLKLHTTGRIILLVDFLLQNVICLSCELFTP